MLSPASLLVAYAVLFDLLDRYDWGQAFVKFACLAALLCLIILVRVSPVGISPAPPSSPRLHAAWVVMLAILTLLLFNRAMLLALENFGEGPRVDIGEMTRDSIRSLLSEGINPYSSRTLNTPRGTPEYWGYKYGPMMLIGYLPSGFADKTGIQTCNFLYLVGTLALIASLASGPRPGGRDGEAPLFCVCLALLPSRVGYELFHQGVIDPFPAILLLGSVASIRGRGWTIAGLLVGLSLSAKFAPAIFFVILMVRRDFRPTFFFGVLLGMVPLIPFALWDGPGLARNYFIFHLLGPKGFDSTSLYSIVPRALHPIFPATQALATLLVVAGNFNRGVDHIDLVFNYLALSLIFEITYVEVHENHLLWIIPFASLYLGWRRHGLTDALAGAISAVVPGPKPRG